MAKVAIKPNILLWAINRTGEPTLIEEKFPNLKEWISNENAPTLKQVEMLAKATSTPLGYFFLPEPPEENLPIPHYRTINDQHNPQPSPNLLETVRMMERRKDWMRDYRIELGQEPLNFIGSAQTSDDPKIIAQKIKDSLNLQKGWASAEKTWEDARRTLIKRIEDIGVIVVVNGIVGNNTRRKLDVNEFRGFVLVDEYSPLIFVNGVDGKAAQMFTLAHELAHLWLGSSAVFDLHDFIPANNEIEKTCNEIAAEFLVPKNELIKIWPTIQHDDDRFQQIARTFKVSEIVAARRTLDLSLISKSSFFDFYETYLKNERQQNGNGAGGNYYLNQNYRVGRPFAEAVMRSAKEGKVLYRDAFRLTGLYGETFFKYAKRLESERGL